MTCAKQCGFCCKTPKYNCKNSDGPLSDELFLFLLTGTLKNQGGGSCRSPNICHNFPIQNLLLTARRWRKICARTQSGETPLLSTARISERSSYLPFVISYPSDVDSVLTEDASMPLLIVTKIRSSVRRQRWPLSRRRIARELADSVLRVSHAITLQSYRSTIIPIISDSTTGGTVGTGTCGDSHPNCGNWVHNGFCQSTGYTDDQKRQYCGRSCGFC